MRKIPLSQGKFALLDSEDFNYINQWNWYYDKGYARTHSKIDNKQLLYMHRLILNFPEDKDIDHINHNTLDNRKSNLRIVTSSQNSMNQRIRKDNTSGYKGVTGYKKNVKWGADI